MERTVLTEGGWNLPADSQYHRVGMTGSGSVAPRGAHFVALKVRSITGGGGSAVVQIRNGRSDAGPLVHQVVATAGAIIDRRSAPDLCNEGLWLTCTGSPTHIDVEVLWK